MITCTGLSVTKIPKSIINWVGTIHLKVVKLSSSIIGK